MGGFAQILVPVDYASASDILEDYIRAARG